MEQWKRPGSGWPVTESLGWLSVGLGLAGLFAPRQMARLTAINSPDLHRLAGARELASGVALLTQRNKTPWLWVRVVGDFTDLAALALAHTPSDKGRSRAMGAAAVVAAIAAADVLASLRHTQAAASRNTSDVYFERTIVVNKTPRECYDYWRDLRNIAKFTSRLQNVTALDERRSHWVMKLPAGPNLEWTAELIEDKPGQRLRWRSAEGAPFQHAVAVGFEPAPGDRGTFVSVSMHYHAPGASVGGTLARFVGPDPFGEVHENLRRFKQLIETGEIPTTIGQPSGRRSIFGRLFSQEAPPGAGRSSSEWRPSKARSGSADKSRRDERVTPDQSAAPNKEVAA